MTHYVIQNTNFKTFLCGDPNTTVNQKKAIGAWEKWTIEQEGGYYFIKSAHGTYLRNDIDKSVNLTPNRGEWEKWFLSKEHDGHYSIRSTHGKFLRCHDKNGIVNSADSYGAWESWIIVKVVDKERWMGSVSDNQCLADLSIPGTHDSASYGVKNLFTKFIAETQKFSIEESLLNGVRFLDIRLRLIDNHLVCHHGQVYLNQNFDDVLRKCEDFLKHHPTETILMRIKKEWHDEKSNITFEQSFQNYVDKNPSLWFQDCRVPNLGEVRGKITLLSHHYPHVQGQSWDFNNIKDEWEVKSLEQKTNGINSHINERIAKCHTHIYSICFFSGYYAKECLNPTKILNPKRFAEDMNPWALSNLPLPKIHASGFGILVFDFINEEICIRMISSNPVFYLEI